MVLPRAGRRGNPPRRTAPAGWSRAVPRPAPARSAPSAGPARHASTGRWRPRAGRSRASDHLQRAVVDGHLWTSQLNLPSLPVVDLDTDRAEDDLLSGSGLQGDPAHTRRVVEDHLVPARGLDDELLVRRREELGGKIRGRAEPAASPHRIVGIALLELDPHRATHRRKADEAHPGPCERRAAHGPAALAVSGAGMGLVGLPPVGGAVWIE